MSTIELRNLYKVYHQKHKEVLAVEGLDLSIKDGSFVALLGPSGCGKSSTLRMIAGLEKISSGHVLFDGEIVNDLSPADRDVAMAFESYGLYPHMTVYENLAFCLRVQGLKKEQIDEKIREVSHLLRIEQILKRKPMVLSGGQQQRVSLGRALIRNPKVSLLDEPLSHIGTEVREQVRTELREIIKKRNTTTIFVTHDQQDALALADYVAVMYDGKLQQFGTSQEVFRRPKNLFVAEFVGEPPINIIECEWKYEEGRSVLRNEALRLSPPREWAKLAQEAGESKILIGIRPQNIYICSDNDSNDKEVSEVIGGKVVVSEWVGNKCHITLELGHTKITAVIPPDREVKAGERLCLRLYWKDICGFGTTTKEAIN